MRSAERRFGGVVRAPGAALAAAWTAACVLAACAGPSAQGDGAQGAPAPRAAMDPSAAQARIAAETAAAPADPQVDPATRKAFNDARQAMLTGHAERAEKGFLALTREHPEFGGPFANLGILYRQAGRLPDSAARLEEAARLGPRQASYRNELGITYRMQGAFAKARAAYEQAIELDPNYPAAVLNLAILHDLYLWEPPRALELYERYMALAPDGDERVAKWAADLRNRQRSEKKKEAQ
jgi:Flp pilus assembly protein TadD